MSDFIVLRPANPPRAPRPNLLLLPHSPSDAEVDAALCSLGTDPVDLDLETTGLDGCDPAQRIVGIGLANQHGAVYLDVRHWREGGLEWAAFLEWLDHVGFWAFNASFDYTWLLRYARGRHLKLLGCTQVLFKLLANEGHPGQRHNLDTAIKEVLRWPASQKSTLEDALVRHGITLSNGNPDKGRMCMLAELEPELFAEYCALDAEASWQLRQVLEPQARESSVWRFATREWPCAIRLKCEAQWHGVKVDRAKLQAFHETLLGQIADTKASLRAHPRLQPHIAEVEARWAEEAARPIVTEWRDVPLKSQWKAAPDDYPERADLNKSSPKWQRELGFRPYRTMRTERPSTKVAKTFNFESDPDLRWLLYERIYPNVTKDLERWLAVVEIEAGKTVEVNLTDGGQVPVGKDILPALGEIGALIGRFNQLTKLEGYVRSYLAGSERDGKMHLDLRAHGAATGRWAGGSGGGKSINPQQFPKVPEVLECFVPDPGEELGDTDVNSLEPRVVAEFSGCPTMHELFVTGKPHDVYLYVAAKLFDDRTDKIDALYHLDNPTKASVAAAREAFPHERKVGKGIHLEAGYGAGAPKMWRGLRNKGVDIELAQVTEMRGRYWSPALFGGVKRWTRGLEREREDRGGWVYNGHGRPLAIPEMRVKDLGNAFAQSTGHDCLLIYLWHVDRLRTERRVPMRPWMPDSHDQTTWCWPVAARAAAVKVFEDAYTALNAELGGAVPIIGGIDVGASFAEFKK